MAKTNRSKLQTCKACRYGKCQENDKFCSQCGNNLSNSKERKKRKCNYKMKISDFNNGVLIICIVFGFCILNTFSQVNAHEHRGHNHHHHKHDEDVCANSDDPAACNEKQYGENANLFHKVGKIFNAEKRRQRRENHNTADAVENGPKEISLYCPSDPQVRIVDLDEAERDRDICLVLNIAAPDINSRLVIFCNSESGSEFTNARNSTESEDT